MMRIYRGYRIASGEAFVKVFPDGWSSQHEKLSRRLDLANHSPDGFEWGYGGSGPAQLALAIVADATGDDVLAIKIYQDFKNLIIARLPRDSGWLLSDGVVKAIITNIPRVR